MSREAEKNIIRRAVNRLLANGHTISVEDEEGYIAVKDSRTTEEVMDGLFSTGLERLRTVHPEHGNSFVLLVHGDGEDVIADYGVKLAELFEDH